MSSINEIGNSTVSSVGNGAVIPTNPGAPTDLAENQDQTTGTQASFTWTAPADDGGIPVISYSVEQYNDADDSFTEVASDVTETFYTQTGLSEDTNYKFRVRAKNGLGFGDYSSELSISTEFVTIGKFVCESQSCSISVNENIIYDCSGSCSEELTVT